MWSLFAFTETDLPNGLMNKRKLEYVIQWNNVQLFVPFVFQV